MNPLVASLAIVLVVATFVAVGSVVAIAIPNLTGLTVPELDLMWKMSAAIGGATGVVLGWLVTHQSSKALETHKTKLAKELADYKQTIDAAQRIVERAAAIDDKTIETVVEGHVELVVKKKLIEHQNENNFALEAYKKEVDLKYQRDILELQNSVAKAEAKRAELVPVLTTLMQAIKDVQASYKSLTRANASLSPEELRARIQAAVNAKGRLDKARAGFQTASPIQPQAFTKLMGRFDRIVFDIITEVRAVPDNGHDALEDPSLRADFGRMEQRMKVFEVHLRTITNYMLMAIERELDPVKFREFRVEQERNIHARALVKIALREQSRQNSVVRQQASTTLKPLGT